MAANVAGYYRVSKARDDMKAPEMYQREIEGYCAYKGLTLKHVFSDIDFSAFRGAPRRPALEDLLKRRGEFQAIVIPKLTRFGRSMKELVQLFDLFDRDGIPLIFLDMNLDTSTSQGRLLRHIMAAFAEYESDVKSDYMRASHRLLAENGYPVGPRAPFGYIKDNQFRTYVVDPERAPIVQEIYARHVQGEPLYRIARDLNRRGIRGGQGGRFSCPRLRTLVDNPAYMGMRFHEGELFPGNWEPLIDRAIWEEARRIRVENARKNPPHSGKPSYLLTGLLFCGICGHKLWHKPGKTGQGRYYCPTSLLEDDCKGRTVVAERAEELVIEAFFASIDHLSSHQGRVMAQSLFASWNGSGVRERTEILSAAIAQVTVMRRRPEDPLPKNAKPLRVKWTEQWTSAGHPSETILPRPQAAPKDPQTWAEFHRESVRQWQAERASSRVRASLGKRA